MDQIDIQHKWPTDIKGYSQKIFGISTEQFLGSGFGGLITFAVLSQMIGGFGGMIGGAILGVIVFGLIILFTTKLANFHHMTMPGYWFRKRFQPAEERKLELPLIVATNRNETVTMESWDGETEGLIE